MSKTTTHRRTGTSAALIAFFAVLIGMAQPSMATQPQVQITKKEVKALIAGAKTPEDHMKLVAYFNQKADQLEAESREHEALAEKYRNDPISQGMAMKMPMSGRTGAHCEYFAKSTSEAAKTQRALAAAHEQMAKDASR